MLFASILNVAIGLILLYIILSLICTAVNELIASVTKVRAANLHATLKGLIDDPQLLDSFLKSGLIASAGIASKAGDSSVTSLPSYLDPRHVAQALIESVGKPNAGADFGAAIEALPESRIKNVVKSCFAAAKNDVDAAKLELAHWFDSSMDRLSGVYTRYMKWVSLVVGLVLVVLFNVDTIAIGTSIWNDDPKQAEISASATHLVQSGLPSTACPASQASKASSNDPAVDCSVSQLVDLTTGLRPFSLGWTRNDLGAAMGSGPAADGSKFDPLLWWLSKITGLLISAIALSLGAPTWFDLLQKVVNIRAAGPKS